VEIHLKNDEIKLVKSILQQELKKVEVWVFGSRVPPASPHKHSDLDLLLKGKEAISLISLSKLSESFENSSLPFKVELVDWHRITPEFQEHIKGHAVKLLPS